MLKNKNLLIGVTAGVAIYKVLDLISKARKRGAVVKVIMTENSTKFISPLLFEAMTENKVYLDTFEKKDLKFPHLDLATWADVFLIAPCTANSLAKIANGLADNLLTNTALAYQGPILFAPSMNTHMLENKITQANLSKLKKQGHLIIEADYGKLACGEVGKGRLAEVKDLLDYLDGYFEEKDLINKKIIVTAGPTVEMIDPVRYLTNRSSAKMGYSLARAARNRGAKVTLIAGPNKLDDLKGVDLIKITSNQELEKAIDDNFSSADALIMAAAPCDFKMEKALDKKIKKSESLDLSLVKNEDIVSKFAHKKTKQTIICFSAETNDHIKNAKDKLKNKACDYILMNDVSKEDRGFDSDLNAGTLISKKASKDIEVMDKYSMANKILDVLVDG